MPFALGRIISEKTKERYKNIFTYEISQGTYIKGYFDIYQAKNGKIFITMGNGNTELNYKQVEDLRIDVYDLIDFDYDLFKKAYNIVEVEKK
ncbi:MAG: hypothetical protein ACYDDE_00740 [bacterium]